MGRDTLRSVAAVLALTLALGGCSSPWPMPSTEVVAPPAVRTQVVTYDDMVAEYRATLLTLSWPVGIAPDPQPPTNDRSSTYQVGFGEGAAVGRWQCAWGSEYLRNRTSDPTVAKTALDEWSSITTMPVWNRAYSDPNTQRLLRDAISKARRGDASVLQSLQVANC